MRTAFATGPKSISVLSPDFLKGRQKLLLKLSVTGDLTDVLDQRDRDYCIAVI